jgi:hypothetical protein
MEKLKEILNKHGAYSKELEKELLRLLEKECFKARVLRAFRKSKWVRTTAFLTENGPNEGRNYIPVSLRDKGRRP